MEQYRFPEERCVMCGAVIPEGRQVCRDCERAILERERQAQEVGGADRKPRRVWRRWLGRGRDHG